METYLIPLYYLNIIYSCKRDFFFKQVFPNGSNE